MSEIQARIDATWADAQRRWSRFLLLSRPVDAAGCPSVARIDLTTRQVEVNGAMIANRKLWDSMEGILAHEVGHHVRYPGSLVVAARLRLLEKEIIPIEEYSLINLFTDLLINERLGRDEGIRAQLLGVYAAFNGEHRTWEQDPAFSFYLAVYEELWQLAPGTLVPHDRFVELHPGYRADAQLLAQDLFHLGPNLYTQFLYFVHVVGRYLAPPQRKSPLSLDPYACGCDTPGPDDWADALTPTAREEEALRRALAEGWLRKDQAGRMRKTDDRIANLPGAGTARADAIPEIMAAFYRREAERHLFRPPAQRVLGEAVVPTTLEEWELGDPVQAIDWLATLVARGDSVGGLQPLKRERIADLEGHDVPLWQPRMEIYLDVSGSMPDPRTTINAMTLAAQVLAVATIRAGGWVRALLFSGHYVRTWEWCRSEVELSRFLMHYMGGGTVFPFEVLEASLAECRAAQPIRVVISDFDMDANVQKSKENEEILARAARLSPHTVLLLHGTRLAQRYRDHGAQVIIVDKLDDFPRMAARLSAALFSRDEVMP
jgi:hypothetical protein